MKENRARDLNTIVTLFAASAFFVLAGLGWALFALREITPPFVLHFKEVAGITQNGGIAPLIGVGSTAIIALAINGVLALHIRDHDPLLSKAIGYATLFMGLLLFVGFHVIISVN